MKPIRRQWEISIVVPFALDLSLSLSFARPGERRLIMYELLTFARLDVAPVSPSPSPTAPVIRREGIKRESRESPCRSLAFSP